MFLIFFALQTVGAVAIENPETVLPMANDQPNALVYVLTSDHATYSFGDEVYLNISIRNVSKGTVYFWQDLATTNFRLVVLPQNGTALPVIGWDRPMTLGAHYPRGVSPAETVIEWGAHGETLIPISEWGYHTLPRGTYHLTVYSYFVKGTNPSSTIQITVK